MARAASCFALKAPAPLRPPAKRRAIAKMLRIFSPSKSPGEYTTHEALGLPLMIGQCFGMFPMEGLLQRDHRALRFRWLSLRTLYTLLYITGVLFILCFHINNTLHVPAVRFNHFVTLLFYSTSLGTTMLFLRLACNWPQLMERCVEIDVRFRRYGCTKSLPTRLKIITVVVLLAALLEHSLYLASALTNISDTHGMPLLPYFLKTNFGYIFEYIPYALWKGSILMVVNVMCTFTWNYMDLFIMLLSTTLASKFKQISNRLKLATDSKLKDIAFWKELRNDYNALAGLCDTIDSGISDITLMSFANNLFIVLVQLFNSLKPRDNHIMGRVYFIYSFGYLVLRTIAVSLYAASIHDTSREPTALLLSVDAEVYNVEIERFLYKIQADPCTLTGKKFFSITKSLIVNIVGAIVTYELVLIQFHANG